MPETGIESTEMTEPTQPSSDATAETTTDDAPEKQVPCGLLPPPASWPVMKHDDPQQSVFAGAAGAIAPNGQHNTGFDEEMKVNVPGREVEFMVRIAGRELVARGGVVITLHGVRSEI